MVSEGGEPLLFSINKEPPVCNEQTTTRELLNEIQELSGLYFLYYKPKYGIETIENDLNFLTERCQKLLRGGTEVHVTTRGTPADVKEEQRECE